MLLSGLREIHSIGLMHRDLKPSNFLIDSNGIIKIGDFGQARIVDKNKELGLVYTLDVGTKWYKAPEILFGKRYYTEKVDIWSMGCIFAELSGHTPLFPGMNDID